MGAETERGRVATVGTFDGLHLGHRKVIETVARLSKTKGGRPLLISFDRHPLETIAPDRAPLLIQSPSERTNSLYREGFEILTLKFTRETSLLTAAEWLRRMRDEHGVETLVVGYDNTFGCDGINMNIEQYRELGRKLGVEIVEAPVAKGVSSSAIRRHIGEGRIEDASAMLGRPFTLTGEVVHGKALGTKIGFPTANLKPHYRAQLPADGVYAADALLPDGSRRRAVVNIGRRPSVDSDGVRSVEAHIIGYEGSLYGERITLRFIKRLRDEIKFDSIDSLASHISYDIRNALKL